MQRGRRNADFARPLRDAQRFASEGYEMSRRLIPDLLLARRPSAILRAVVAIIVDAINACARRAATHVAQEDFERAHPFSANLDAPTAVPCVSVVRRIGTAIFHAVPNRVLARELSVLHGAGYANPAPNLFAQASAACRSTRRERSVEHPFRLTAIAHAEPIHRPALAALALFGHGQPAEPASREIVPSQSMKRGRIRDSHCRVLSQRMGLWSGPRRVDRTPGPDFNFNVSAMAWV